MNYFPKLTLYYKTIEEQTFLIVFGSIIIALSAQCTIPLYPVPITLQTFAIGFVAMIFGANLGFYSVMMYLVEGAMGLPVFASMQGGMQVFMGPTGGYLIAFPIAAWLAGYMLEKGLAKNRLGIIIASLISSALVLLQGMAWLGTSIGIAKAYQIGVKPFILIECAKALMLSTIVPYAWSRS